MHYVNIALTSTALIKKQNTLIEQSTTIAIILYDLLIQVFVINNILQNG